MAYNLVYVSLPSGSPPVIGSQYMGSGGGEQEGGAGGGTVFGGDGIDSGTRPFYWFEGLINDNNMTNPVLQPSSEAGGVDIRMEFDVYLDAIDPSMIMSSSSSNSHYIYNNNGNLIVKMGSLFLRLDGALSAGTWIHISIVRDVLAQTLTITSDLDGGVTVTGAASSEAVSWDRFGRYYNDTIRLVGMLANVTFDWGNTGSPDHFFPMNEGVGATAFEDLVGDSDADLSGILAHNWGDFTRLPGGGNGHWSGTNLPTPRSFPGSTMLITIQGTAAGGGAASTLREFFWFEGIVDDFTLNTPITVPTGNFEISFDMCIPTVAATSSSIVLATDTTAAYVYQNKLDLTVTWGSTNLILVDFIQPNELTTITITRMSNNRTKIHSTSQGGREIEAEIGTNAITFAKVGRFTTDILRYQGIIADLSFDLGHNGTVDHFYAIDEGSGTVFVDSAGNSPGSGFNELAHNWGSFDEIGTQWVGQSLDTPRSFPSATYTMEIV